MQTLFYLHPHFLASFVIYSRHSERVNNSGLYTYIYLYILRVAVMSFEEILGRNLHGIVYRMEDGEHVYFLSLSPDHKYVAAVFGNGALRIMDPLTLELFARSLPGKPYDDLPCTCVRWLPKELEEETCKSYRLISVSSAGGIFGWKWDGTDLFRFKKLEEKGNEISLVDISPKGDTFLTCGKDRIVRLYNSETFQLIGELKKGINDDGSLRTTHTSRVFSVRFVTATLAASAGWESPLQLWDLRTLRSEREIVGTQGSSDCVEPIAHSCLLLFTDTKSSPKLRVLDPISRNEREEETRIINEKLTASDNPLVSRFCPSTSSIWCACSSPNKVINVLLSTGSIVGEIDLPGSPLNLTIDDYNGMMIYVSCQDGQIVVVRPG